MNDTYIKVELDSAAEARLIHLMEVTHNTKNIMITAKTNQSGVRYLEYEFDDNVFDSIQHYLENEAQ